MGRETRPSVGGAEQPGQRNVLVEVRPVDSDATAGELPVGALRGGRATEPRKGLQGHTDDTAVGQMDHERVRGETDPLDAGRGRLFRAGSTQVRLASNIARGRELVERDVAFDQAGRTCKPVLRKSSPMHSSGCSARLATA